MSVEKFPYRFTASRAIVDRQGRASREFALALQELFESFNTNADETESAGQDATNAQAAADAAQTTADTAQTTADGAQTAADTAQTTADGAQTTADAAQTAADGAQVTADNAAHTIAPFVKTGHQWQSDSSGVFTPGDPSEVLGIAVVDKNGTQRATRTLSGQLTSVAGTVAVTANTDSADPGYSTSFVVQADGTANPRGDITITFPDSTTTLTTVGWGAIDASVASSIPGGGGGK